MEVCGPQHKRNLWKYVLLSCVTFRGFPEAKAFYTCQPNGWLKQKCKVFFFFFLVKSFILKVGRSRRCLSRIPLPMDTARCCVIICYCSQNVESVQHDVLWALAQGLPDLGSESEDTYHWRAVCSLRSRAISKILTFNEMIAPVCHCN